MRVRQFEYERDMNKRDRLSYIAEVVLAVLIVIVVVALIAAILTPSGGVWVGK